MRKVVRRFITYIYDIMEYNKHNFIKSGGINVNLSKERYLEILNTALSQGGDYSEIFFEDYYATSILYDNGKFEGSSYSKRNGASLRVVIGEETLFAHTSSPDYASLKKIAENLSSIAKTRASSAEIKKVLDLKELPKRDLIKIEKEFDKIPVEEKMEKINMAVKVAKEYDPRIIQITVRYGDSKRTVRVVNSEGIIADDVRSYPIFYVSIVAKSDDGQIFTGMAGNSENKGFEFFDDDMIVQTAKDACGQAIAQVEGEDAPAGEFTVVMSSQAGGTMIHEACGHGMEADLVLSGSVYREKVGQKIASEKVTVVDDGTIPGKRGTLNYDDEGSQTQRTVLIENGILKGYMHTKITAKIFGTEPTGNSRRETYMNLPIVRMRNTLILPGNDNPDDIIKSVEKGVFVKKMGGGQVDVISGDFQFKITEGYNIENGKITTSLRGASIVGNGLKVLQSIDMVGNDLGYAVGTCGKDGQGAPVSDAQPTIRVPKMIVGGVVKGGKSK